MKNRNDFLFIGAVAFITISSVFIPNLIAETLPHFDPSDDAASFEFETYFQQRTEGNEIRSDEEFSRTSLQAFFPLVNVGGKNVFGGIRSEVFTKEFRDTVERLNAHNLNRHSLSLGSELIKNNNHESLILVTGGYNGDLQVNLQKTLSGEFIYAHFYTGIRRCKIGLGFDMLWYGDNWMPYPLIFLEWWVWQNTKLRFNADRGEIRQFIGRNLCLTLGTRYNLYFGAFDRLESGSSSQSLISESYLLETGIEYPVFDHFFIRFKFTKTYWGEERISNEIEEERVRKISDGYSIKLALAFAF